MAHFHTLRNGGILNAHLAGRLAGLRHMDTFVISDAGFPVAKGVEVIDLALVYGIPTFEQVLRAVNDHVVLEDAWVAEEMSKGNPDQLATIESVLSEVPITRVSLTQMIADAATAKFVVHTGENTPYSNVILSGGRILQ